MSASKDPSCTQCGTTACKFRPGEKKPPSFCPATSHEELLADVRRIYESDPEIRKLALMAARTEAGGYCRDTRVVEIMAFARRIGARHLGIACCVGTQREGRLAQEIFTAHGFRVSSVVCKVGSIPKEEMGLSEQEKIRPGEFEALCNPVAQARLLAEAGTQLNVLVGLCVGHDSLFFRSSEAPVTVLLAKDRVTGHNPAAALYTSHSYYKRLREEAGETD
jgi:uncharacterized metal-binding protein